MKSKSILVMATVMIQLAISTARAEVLYNITDLGSGAAWSINSSGQVVGNFGLWENGILTPLGGEGRAINASGQIVVQTGSNSFLWENGNTTPIGGYANGINDEGIVVGRDGFSAWKWGKNGGKIYLGDGMNDAYGINSQGQIAGMVRNTENLLMPALWNGSGNVIDLGTFGGVVNDSSAVNGNANGINKSGQVVGYTRNTDNDNYNAFIWDSENGLQNLGILGDSGGSYALSIDDSSVAVGFSDVPLFGEDDHAFVWDETRGIIDLNTLIPINSGWDYLRIARDIDNQGRIVGEGYINGQAHGFLLTPIPEPTTLLLLGLGAMILRKK